MGIAIIVLGTTMAFKSTKVDYGMSIIFYIPNPCWMGISVVVFTSTLGIGVIFSSVPVFLYQGIIALSATLITLFVSNEALNAVITEITAVGGVLIIGIGLNILAIKKIRVANLLPSLLIAAISVMILQ